MMWVGVLLLITLARVVCAGELLEEKQTIACVLQLDLPKVTLRLKSGENLNGELDGVDEITDHKFQDVVRKHMEGAFVTQYQDNGKTKFFLTKSIDANAIESEKLMSLQFWGDATGRLINLNNLIIVRGWAKWKVCSENFFSPENHNDIKVCLDGLKDNVSYIKRIGDPQVNQEVLSKIHAVTLHARSAIPIYLNWMKSTDNEVVAHGCVGLGFAGNDKPEYARNLFNCLENCPSAALSALSWFDSGLKPLEEQIVIKLISGKFEHGHSSREAVAVLRKIRYLNASSLEMLDRAKSDPRLKKATQLTIEFLLTELDAESIGPERLKTQQ